MEFHVDQIDHVELTVPDRSEAAKWYHRVLGLEIIKDFEFWAEDPQGPLMIGTIDAGTKLALFTGQPNGSVRGTGFHRVAFRVSGNMFAAFLQRLEHLSLLDQNNQRVTQSDVVDHQKSISIYFCDPWQNQLELTTYDVEMIAEYAEKQ